MASKKAKKRPIAAGVSLRSAQDRATEIWEQARKQVDRYLPEGSAKQLGQLRTRVQRTARDLEKARDRALKDTRSRFESVLSGLEKTAAGVMKPIVDRLDIASKSDVDRLRRRIADLEKRLHKVRTTATAA